MFSFQFKEYYLAFILWSFKVSYHCNFYLQPAEIDKKGEPWRASLEMEFGAYVTQHYPHACYSVFCKTSGNLVTLVACIEDHKFEPRNFW